MNPIFRAEVRGLLRERRAWLVPMIYAAVLAATAHMILWETSRVEERSAQFGPAIASVVAVVQTIAVVLLGAVMGAASIAGERDRGTWTRLLSSPIERWRIAAGKVSSITLYILTLLLISLPIATLSLLRGGTDVAALVGLYATHAVIGVTVACISMAISSMFHRTWAAVLVALAVTFGLMIFTGTVALSFTSSGGQSTAWSDAVLFFNPVYGTYLFFSGDADGSSPVRWAFHYAAMAAMAGASIAFVCAKLRRMCD
jgi:ABC-type transport system involved in multi-copper enzyme maturation permease subunit